MGKIIIKVSYILQLRLPKVINVIPMEILTKINTHIVFKDLADILNIQLYNPTKNYVPYQCFTLEICPY